MATFLLFTLPIGAANTNGEDVSEKVVMQNSNPNAEHYFNNRRALVGPGCTINSIGDGVQVVSGTANLQNLCNDDMDDYATIPALVGATVVASPIISVKDNQHYYAGGTCHSPSPPCQRRDLHEKRRDTGTPVSQTPSSSGQRFVLQ